MKHWWLRTLSVSLLLLGGAVLWLALGSCAQRGSGPPAQAPSSGAEAVPSVSDAAAPSPARVSKANARSAVGYNLDFPGDWTGLPPFIDLMKNARAWRGVCSDADPECDPIRHLNLTAAGWVSSLAYRDDPERSYERVETVVVTREGSNGFEGDLVLDYEGSGDIELFNGTVVSEDKQSRRVVFRAGEGSLFLRVWASDPAGKGDPLRNIRVYRADQEAALARGELFNPEMLDYLAPFGSLRFMDWMESNQFGLCGGGLRSGQECYPEAKECGTGRCVMPGRWSERPQMGQVSLFARSQFRDVKDPAAGVRTGGYPVEVMVQLANAVGADPHFNMPAVYEDEYVLEFARLVNATLAPNLRPTVEYSNEVWNWGFPQADYANVMGRRLWPDVGSAWVQFAASRTQHLCLLWKQVFSDQPGRVRCLISPQTGWFDLAETMLDCPDWVALHPELGACHGPADAVAITGYFSGCLQEPHNFPALHGWLKKGKAYALDRFFEQLETGKLLTCSDDDAKASLADVAQLYRDFSAAARKRDLELYVYESGTHFNYEGDDEALRRLFVDATHDPRMGTLYRKNLDAFREAGGTIMNAWGWIAADDMWSNVDHITDRAHPKYKALADFARDVPCWWPECDRSQR